MASLCAVSSPVGAAAYPGSGIANTAHDFVSGQFTFATRPVGMCTFCHTPHKASSSRLLWNHTLSKSHFKWDVSATSAGTSLPGFLGNTYTGPSAKCLSCHDGTVAIGDVNWFNGASRTGSNSLLDSRIGPGAADSVGYAGNLSGNHPVAVPYPYHRASSVYNGSTSGSGLIAADWVSDPSATGRIKHYAANGAGQGGIDATSYIKRYTDNGAGQISSGATAGRTGIECSSCHDPHNRSTVDVYFLRAKLTGTTRASGYICLQCHIK